MGVTVEGRPTGRPALYEGPLVDWNVDVAKWVIDFLRKNKRNASGDSSDFVIKTTKKPTQVHLIGTPYLGFALSGRKQGTPPPIFRILEWVNTKPAFAGIDEQTLNGIAWAIRTNIAKRGWSKKTKTIRPQEFGKIIKKLGEPHLAKMAEGLGREMAKDIFANFSRRKNVTLLQTLKR